MNIPGKTPFKASVDHVCVVLVVKISLKNENILRLLMAGFLVYLFIVDPCSMEARVVDICLAQSVDPHESSHLNRSVLSCL